MSTMSVSGEAVNRDLMTYKVSHSLQQVAEISQQAAGAIEACREHLSLVNLYKCVL